MDGFVVTIGGEVVARDAPLLRGDDLGVVRGDGVFEALLVVDGQPDRLGDHLDRLDRSASMVDLVPPGREAWAAAIGAAAGHWDGAGDFVARLIVTRGPAGAAPTAYLIAEPVDDAVLAERRDGVDVVTLDRGLDPDLTVRAPWLLMGAKTVSYAVNMAALRHARAHGAHDALFVAPDGSLLEGPTSSVVLSVGAALLSPPPSLGILPSVTVKRLFEAAAAEGREARFERLATADLAAADGVWLLSSVRLAARVRTVDGAAMADRDGDDVARLVQPAYAGRHERA